MSPAHPPRASPASSPDETSGRPEGEGKGEPTGANSCAHDAHAGTRDAVVGAAPASPPDTPGATDPTPGPKPSPTPTALTELRIEQVLGMMAAGTFRTGQTARELAVEWGVSYQRAREITAEASKRVKASLQADEVSVELNSILLGTLRKVAGANEPDGRSVAALSKEVRELAGLTNVAKVELSGPNGGAIQVKGPLLFLPPERDADEPAPAPPPPAPAAPPSPDAPDTPALPAPSAPPVPEAAPPAAFTPSAAPPATTPPVSPRSGLQLPPERDE